MNELPEPAAGPQAEHLSAIAQHVPGGMFRLDSTLRFRYASALYERWFQRPLAEIIGRTPREILAPEHYEIVHGLLLRALAGETVQYLNVVPHPQGAHHRAQITMSPEYGADGQVQGVVATFIDVTELERARRAAADNEARLQALMDAIPDRIWLKDASGVYRACNPAFLAYFGLQADQVLGRRDADFLDADTAHRFHLTDQAALRARAPHTIEDTQTRASATRPQVAEITKATVRNEAGTLIGVLGVARDITARRAAEEAARTSTAALEVTLESMSQGIVQFDARGRVTVYNHRVLELLDIPESVLAQHPTLLELTRYQSERGDFDSGAEEAAAALQKFIESGEHSDLPDVYVRRSRSGRILEVRTRRLSNGTWVRTFTDVTDYVRANESLQAERQRLAQILEGTQAGTWEWDVRTNHIAINARWAALVGYPLEEMQPLTRERFQQLQHPEDQERMRERWEAHQSGRAERYECDLRLRHRAGHWVWVLSRGRIVHAEGTGEPRLVAGTTVDISELKHAEGQLRTLAQHDMLTGLANRTLLSDRLQRAMAAARREGRRVALLFIDLDKFKPINDRLGHAVGDALLRAVATRMLGCVREADSVARIGGDEFVVLLPHLNDPLDAVRVGEKLRGALCQPFAAAGHALQISGSVGIALYPDHGADERTLLLSADQAMYQAKHAGRGTVQLFQPAPPA